MDGDTLGRAGQPRSLVPESAGREGVLAGCQLYAHVRSLEAGPFWYSRTNGMRQHNTIIDSHSKTKTKSKSLQVHLDKLSMWLYIER